MKIYLQDKREIMKGFSEMKELLAELDKHPEKLKRLPDKGILTRRGKKFVIKPDNGNKLIVL